MHCSLSSADVQTLATLASACAERSERVSATSLFQKPWQSKFRSALRQDRSLAVLQILIMASASPAVIATRPTISTLVWRKVFSLKPSCGFSSDRTPRMKVVMKPKNAWGLREANGVLVVRCRAESVEQSRAQVLEESRRRTKEEFETARADYKKQGLAQYETLKRELSQATVNVAVGVSAYCFLVLSFEAAVSYGIGALASLGYLQLLYRHVDSICEDNIPEVFAPERRWKKRIGIRSEDFRKFLQRTAQGSSLALASPRLVIPVALFGLWELTSRFNESPIQLQVTPLMMGFFAYKAAALLQAYQDNKDLFLDFPGSKGPEDL